MSKPYSQPGEKGTDTNQASEDVLREELADKLEWYSRYRERGQDDDMDRAFDGILALIRTEKLKLLAEVRERVVGEDYDIPAEMEKVGRDFQQLDAIAKTGGLLNKFKADLRTKLTKLEAEL